MKVGSTFMHFEKEAATHPGNEVETCADMFKRNNFLLLQSAVEKMIMSSSDTNALKAGLQLNLRYLIQTSAEVMQGHHLINNRDDLAMETEKFLQVFKMKRFYHFGDAEYKVKKDRQVQLRKPEA